MSAAEAKIQFNVKCRDCDFEEKDCDSPAQAENFAFNHVNKDEGGDFPNYDHRVEITKVCLVGRDI